MLDCRIPWKGEAYRNIATCDPTQDLFDDMVDPEDYETLFEIENLTSGIDKTRPLYERVFQYSEIDRSTLCFEKFFSFGRYSDGSYGVWYGALEEETSIKETSYKPPVIDSNDLSNANGPIIQCRRIFKAQIEAEIVVDLREHLSDNPALVSEDYSFCQKLAKRGREDGIEAFLAPSARNDSGTCIPLFTSSVIKTERALRTYLVIYDKSGNVSIAPISHQDHTFSP